ncbi:MAG: hypothetical protein AAF640_10300 [Pseudomonadota bacterium]
MYKKRNLCATALVIALGAAPIAMAGTATMQSADGNSATFEYNSRMLRMGAGDDNAGYTVVRDGSLYVVSMNNGQPMVMDAGSMIRTMAPNFANAAPSDLSSEFLGLKKTGRSETVAEVKGDVYELRFKDENGREQSEEVVLSDDRRALEFRDALFLMMDVAASLTSDDNMKAGRSIQAELLNIDLGVLRYGNEMRLTSIDSQRVDPARFELPAEPMNLQDLGNMFNAMANEPPATTTESPEQPAQSGGLFSSMMKAMGDKAERAGESAGQEVDRETDEQIDNAVGNAFNKLFRRQ